MKEKNRHTPPPHSDVARVALLNALLRGVIILGIGVAAYWVFID